MSPRFLAAAAALAFAATSADAVTVNWANWGPSVGPNVTSIAPGVVGSSPATMVSVASSSFLWFIQGDNTLDSNDYFIEGTPKPYTGGVVTNRPPAFELIGLGAGGRVDITFGAPVTDVYLAFVSWNGNIAQFSAPFTIVSQGQGFWGSGTFIPNGTSDGFTGSGEVHGLLKFAGTFTSLSFTHSSEFWHGFTLGVASISAPPPPPPPPTPAPATLALLGLGVALIGLRRR